MHWTALVPRRGRFPHYEPLLNDAPPVIFLHGTLSSAGNFERAATAVHSHGRSVYALDYNKRGTGSLADSVSEVAEFLEQFPSFEIVGHSMGGLVGLELAPLFGGRMRTLVGLGACWRGVPAIGINRLSRLLGPGYRDALVARTPQLPQQTRVVSIVSDTDKTVPVESASLGEVIMLHGVHHAHLPNHTEAIVKALKLNGSTRPSH